MMNLRIALRSLFVMISARAMTNPLKLDGDDDTHPFVNVQVPGR